MGMQLVKPEPGSRDYTVIARFRSLAERRAFTSSADYEKWMQPLADVTEGDPRISELSGMETWFAPAGERKPPKWKMALLTFVGVYVLTTSIAVIVGPLLLKWPLPLRTAIVAAIVVLALTWLIMPFFARYLHDWLYDGR